MVNLTVNINEKNKTYPIYINHDDINTLKDLILENINHKNYIVVISKKVHKLYSKSLNFPKDKIFIMPDGENQKNKKNLEKILNFALKKQLKREDAIIAIGGGVVGDIAGFASCIYMRGINFIQVPTTLLAATDSSVGGKTAINSKYGKNLIGTFYQPKAVFININFLKTLDEKEFKSGLGEVIKYGLIEKNCNPDAEAELINYLTVNQDKILKKDILTLSKIVQMSVELKIKVVEKDEKESGLRKILNFGHTYGHAIENITNYKKYTHGQCVIEGILFALKLALKLNLIDKEYKFLCQDLIYKYDYKPLPKYNFDKVIKIMQSDKKSTSQHLKFILPTAYATVIEYDFTPDELKRIFHS